MEFIAEQYQTLYSPPIKNIKITYDNASHILNAHALASISTFCRNAPEQPADECFDINSHGYIKTERDFVCFLEMCPKIPINIINNGYEDHGYEIDCPTIMEIYAAGALCDYLGIKAQICLNLIEGSTVLETVFSKEPLWMLIYHQVLIKTNNSRGIEEFEAYVERKYEPNPVTLYDTYNLRVHAMHTFYFRTAVQCSKMRITKETADFIFNILGWSKDGQKFYGYNFRFGNGLE